MPPLAALFGKPEKSKVKTTLDLAFVYQYCLPSPMRLNASMIAVNAEQHEVCADDVSNRRNRDVRAEYHHNAEHKSDNVDYHREPVDEIARDEPNRVQVRESRETVRDEPYREQE